MIESILVATDGSEAAVTAEGCAIALASRLRARLAGLSVVEDRDIRAPASEGLSLPPFPEAELAAYHRARTDAVARRFSDAALSKGIEAACEVMQGGADERIVDKAQGSDLLVIGRDGKSTAGRGALIGSTVSAAIRKTSKAALVVPAGAPLAGPIVLAFDGSDGARVAARLAVHVANATGEGVHVFVDSKDKSRAQARFEEVRQLVEGLSVPVRETASTLGRPDVKIVDAAREVRAGMIVMGAYARNRITDFFLGSNATSVVRTANCAVLLAR
jgi:nucleotide-binding universal stress UspA family protein